MTGAEEVQIQARLKTVRKKVSSARGEALARTGVLLQGDL